MTAGVQRLYLGNLSTMHNFFFVLGIMGNAKTLRSHTNWNVMRPVIFLQIYAPPPLVCCTHYCDVRQSDLCVRLSARFSVAGILFLAAVLTLCLSRSDSFPVMNCVKDEVSIERSSKTRGKGRFSSDILCLFSEQKKKKSICQKTE